MLPLRSMQERYTLLEELGRGSMAKCFKARGPSGEVVVKVDDSPETGVEAHFQRMCAGEHVLRILDTWTSPFYHVLVLPICRSSLHRYMSSCGRIDEDVAYNFCLQIAEGMAHIHSFGILHRDLHTGNVLVGSSMDPEGPPPLFIADFGRATDMPVVDERLTLYPVELRPPELLFVGSRVVRGAWAQNGKPDYSTPADVWAMGCMWVTIFSGSGPLKRMDAINELSCACRMVEVFGPPDLIFASQRKWTFFDRDYEMQWKYRTNAKKTGTPVSLDVPSSIFEYALAALRWNAERRPSAKTLAKQAFTGTEGVDVVL